MLKFAVFACLLAVAMAAPDQVFPRSTLIQSQYNVSQQITAPLGKNILIMNLPMDQTAQVEAYLLNWNSPYGSPMWTPTTPLPFVNPDSPNLVQFDQTVSTCSSKFLLFTGYDSVYLGADGGMGSVVFNTPVTRVTQNKQFSYQQVGPWVLGAGGALADGTYTDIIDVYDCVNGPNPGTDLRLADKQSCPSLLTWARSFSSLPVWLRILATSRSLLPLKSSTLLRTVAPGLFRTPCCPPLVIKLLLPLLLALLVAWFWLLVVPLE